MRLPRAHHAIVEERKIVEYLLNANSEHGRHKARFFTAFGFSLETWSTLSEALLLHGQTYECAEVRDNFPYGFTYSLDGALQTPDGRNPIVRTVWEVEIEGGNPRLITAHPR